MIINLNDVYWEAIWHAGGGEPNTDDVNIRGQTIERGREAILNMDNLELLELIATVLKMEAKNENQIR